MPEITLNDEFGQAISNTIEKYCYTKNLEIGSWDGTGSTQCFIAGMEKLPIAFDNNRVLHCVEISPERFLQLADNTKQYEWITSFYMSSITKEQFIPKSFDEIWDSPFNHLPEGELVFPKEMVKGWYDEDMVKLSSISKGFLTSKHCLPWYDAVLIDGSEFTGYSEFTLLKDKTKCFMLDDVFTAFKCAQIYDELLYDDPDWELLEFNKTLRNGYAIFRHINR